MDGRRTSKPNYNYRLQRQHQFFLLLQSATIVMKSLTVITKSDNFIPITTGNTKCDKTENRCNFCHNQFKGALSCNRLTYSR